MKDSPILSSDAFKKIESGLKDAIDYANGDLSKGVEHKLTIGRPKKSQK